MFIKNVIINVIYFVHKLKRFLFGGRNYQVLKAELTYTHVPIENENDIVFDPFWNTEFKYWDDIDDTEHVIDVTNFARMNTVNDIVIPDCVRDVCVCVTYVYNSKTWKYFTRNMNYSWPPVQSDEMKFSLPLLRVELLDGDKNVVKNVTERFKMYSGPYGNMFEEMVTPYDLFTEEFEYLKIVNLIGHVSLTRIDEIIHLP